MRRFALKMFRNCRNGGKNFAVVIIDGSVKWTLSYGSVSVTSTFRNASNNVAHIFDVCFLAAMSVLIK